MLQAGFLPIGGIEYHQAAANIYNLNHVTPVAVADVMDVDRIPTVDLLWISPPCPSFSIASVHRGETDRDVSMANQVARLIVESRPRSVAIENVRGYAQSQSLRIILDRLASAGYKIAQSIECAADFGAPTTRSRLIVRATLDRLATLTPTHQRRSAQLSLFPLPSWVSWWDAIADRVHELPKSRLTDRQKATLINQGIELPLLVDSIGNDRHSSYTVRSCDAPAHTITATIHKHPIRILVDLNNPVLIERVGYYRVSHNVWDGVECLSADVRCLAAWQGFPRDYQWGDNRGEAVKAIGNAVPPPLASAVAKSFRYG